MDGNTGWVSVGTDHDTSAFAVATLRAWWDSIGRCRYPSAGRLLICAGGGGSNGSRVRAWQGRARPLCRRHRSGGDRRPPAACTGKWNTIEDRLFSQITMNWRGRPLKTHQIIVDLISNTSTATGLSVHAVLDTGQYPTGTGYTDRDFSALPLLRHDFHGEWNHTLKPADTL